MQRGPFLLLLALVIANLEPIPVYHVQVCGLGRGTFHGFPAIQRSVLFDVDGMSAVRYVDGFIANVLAMFVLLLFGRWVLERGRARLGSEWPLWLPWMVLLPCCIPLVLDLFTKEWLWTADLDMECVKIRFREKGWQLSSR